MRSKRFDRNQTRFKISTSKINKGISKGTLYNHSVADTSTKSNEDTRRPKRSCFVYLRSDHRLRYCEDFKKLPSSDRIRLVEERRLCKVCLNDHGNAECKFKLRCNVGTYQQCHNPLLHPTQTTVSINTHVGVNNSILLRMIPIILQCGLKSVKI
jgi:hypothetical protein